MSLIEIEFLTIDETEREIAKRYWQLGENDQFMFSVAQIAETFGLDSNRVAAKVNGLCRAVYRGRSCNVCGKPPIIQNRTGYRDRGVRGTWTWTCKACLDAKEAEVRMEEERKAARGRLMLQEELDNTLRLSVDRLSLTDAVYVVSLLRSCGSEDLSFIIPHDSSKVLLSPTVDFDREMLDHLQKRRIIAIHPASGPGSVILEGDDVKYWPFKVHWVLPLPKEGPSAAAFLEKTESLLRSGEWPDSWSDELGELHRRIALQECLQYLQVAMKEHGFDPNIGEKTLLVIRSALCTFSVGQMYNFIWRAVKDAAAYYVRQGIAKTHAANIVPGSIQRMAEHAIAEGWQVKAYHRDFRAPQSQLSQVVFTLILQLPDDGLTTIPPAPKEGVKE